MLFLGLRNAKRALAALLCVVAFALVGCTRNQAMETRVYLVDEVFWKALAGGENASPDYVYRDEEASQELEEFLEAMDVVFPEGASVTLNRSDKMVTLRNLSEQVDRIEKLLGPMKGEGSFYTERIQ